MLPLDIEKGKCAEFLHSVFSRFRFNSDIYQDLQPALSKGPEWGINDGIWQCSYKLPPIFPLVTAKRLPSF